MTDYERKRRDECIKLRSSERKLKEMVRDLIHQRDKAIREKENIIAQGHTLEWAYKQLCQGLGKKP